MNFVHLRVHSEYSVTDSIVRLDGLVEAAHKDSQPAVAVTDLGNTFGWIKFYKAARGKGVKPILGVDVQITNPKERDRPFKALLLAKNRSGYLRLCELLSRAWIENEYRGRGELIMEWFDQGDVAGNLGLIVLSGAVDGDVGQSLIAGREEAAEQLAATWLKRFPGAYFLELQRAGREQDERHVRLAAKLGAKMGIPLVATHPVQFLLHEEFRAHEARVCIAEGEILANPRRNKRFTDQQYFKSQEEMATLFADLPQALANTVRIAEMCSVSMTLGKAFLPDFPTPNGQPLDAYMRELSEAGLQERMLKLFPDPAVRETHQAFYQARLSFECDTIVEMGFSGYFLIVADFINWAKKNAVPVGPGRGSGAGSLVAFSLGITDLDPIPYALLFERFLNPERVSMPDFDIDFCQDNRYKVIDYVRQRYGAQAVSQIATFGTMASKAVIRDAGRVLDMGYNFCDQLSKLIPVVQNKPLSLKNAREQEPLLKEREENEDEVRELLALAGPLEDLIRNVGMHAGGVLIAPGKLTDFCPLYKQPGAESTVVSQYDKDDVEAVGLVKFDFLGLRNLTIIDLAVRYIAKRHPTLGLDLQTLKFDDPAAYQVLRDANTNAIFQVESDGMKKLLKKLQPDRFEDIIAVLALYRPGPLGSGMVDDFILRKKGQQKIDYFHPDLQKTLEPTYGVIVYQEQVMQIAQTIGGYTLGGADLLRRAMGKKNATEMAQHRSIFVEGAKKKEYSESLANQLFDLMAMFAEYGFNKSHTAAYAVVTYHTAWLKAHYPAEFMAATLSADMDDTDKVQLFVADAKSNGVRVLGPDVNHSAYFFEPVDVPGVKASFRYGLGAVKGCGQNAVLNIIQARAQAPFKDLFDFCARIDRKLVNRRAIEALVRSGAFDCVDENRGKLLANVGRAMDSADAQLASINQVSLFGEDDPSSGSAPQWIDAASWVERQRLQEEKQALGFYLSGHLFTEHEKEVRRFARTRVKDIAPGQQLVWVAGIVASLRTQMTRRGKMLVVMLDDASGGIEIPLYNELYEKHKSIVREDELLVIQAKISKDDYSGGFRINVERVLDLGQARQEFAKALRIRMNESHNSVDGQSLKTVLSPFLGSLPVILDIQDACGTCSLQLGDAWRVRADPALVSEIAQRLKPCSVEVEY
jgi:DNA polymerase III subunit alpha